MNVNVNENPPTLPTETPPPLPPEHERRMGYAGIGATNKTPFKTGENSALPDAFYNDCDSRARLQREQPHHRRIIDLTLQGFTITEITTLLDLSRPTVKNVLRQPWARERMIEQSKKDVLGEVGEMLKQELVNSVQKMIEIRDSTTTRPETQLAASKEIIDRVLGKTAQPILTGKIDAKKLSDDELELIARGGASGAGTN